jgi:Ca2+-binding EF-hand superfamily protein
LDTNTDGKLSKEEVASNERMSSAFADYDTNKDGSVDQSEITAMMRKRMAAGGAGGGGGGPSRGAPSN